MTLTSKNVFETIILSQFAEYRNHICSSWIRQYIFLFFLETLIIVTADHSHVFTIGGYPKRGNPVFGLIKQVDDQFTLSADGNPYTTLGYADGPGGLNGSRPNITSEDTADKDFLQQATVLLDYESHASEDVGKDVDEF